ncbi:MULTISPECIES: cysteine synthase A [Auritidibacter]|uniref:Cysteine synthase n=2 Tax=Micrococcaceae TaxID=1268 RepID=A0AAJ6AMC4_9MICC|nr:MULTISPECIES: cysteine synthase A [Auritidibacter]PXA79299.1 cysteine synthase A [Auritidibacter sp. NML120779]AXR73336.1 cysteine synthase A [Auritidibacter sp. NML130574]NIH70888.1 cysteine synthase A [Auritidibacter ignavus]PXA76181.1 cysteine synthase A [Auritidibacter sp. NML100628]PXA82091.1 cysteine synthase A [Auritidibacter sp. NML120636]
MALLNNITEAVGHTPLVKLNRLDQDLPGNVAAKVEFYNPANSVKDRIGVAIINAAEKSGELRPGGIVVEGTSGNTGIALAMVGAARGYRVILTMPETMSAERRVMLRAYGAEIVLTPGADGMRGAVEKAQQIVAESDNAIWARQFANEANVQAHYDTTGPELWEDSDGAIDVLVSGIGTGGTLTGAGRYLREQKPELKIVAVEPADSPILSGGKPGPHKIQGIGANFVPEVLDTELYNEVYAATLEESVKAARDLGTQEGILGGISAGAIISAALAEAAKSDNEGKLIVAIIPDFGERYISTVLYEDIRG